MATKSPKGMRPCPATGGLISSVDCGSKRNSELSCPASCPFNPFGPAGYDLWLRLDGTWTPKAAEWIVKCVGADEFREMLESCAGDGGLEEAFDHDLAFASAIHWYLGWYRGFDGLTLGEAWRKAGWPGLNNDERVMSEHRCRSFPTLLEVERPEDGQSVWARDLWAGPDSAAFLLVDRMAAKELVRFDLVISWVTRYPHFARFVGGGLHLPRDLLEAFEYEWRAFAREELNLKRKPTADQMRSVLASDFDYAHELIADLGADARQAMLRNADLQVCSAFYRIAGPAPAVLDRIVSCPEFEACESEAGEDLPESTAFTWLRRGESKRIEAKMPEAFQHPDDESLGVGILGRVSVGPKGVLVRTMSGQKHDFARERVAEIFGPLLEFVKESRIDAAAQLADRIESDEDDETDTDDPPAEDIPPAVRVEVLRMAMEKHFAGLADAKLPIFGGRSAREAARIPKLRPAVVSWAKDQWESAARLGRRDGTDITDYPRRLAAELGLDELKDG